jgi:hypothetical protein
MEMRCKEKERRSTETERRYTEMQAGDEMK